jgi:hypothetical protein
MDAPSFWYDQKMSHLYMPPHGNSKVQRFIYQNPKLAAYGALALLAVNAATATAAATKGIPVIPWVTCLAFTAFMANRRKILRHAILKGTIEGAMVSQKDPGLIPCDEIRPALEGAFDIIYALADTQCTGYLNSAWSELNKCFVDGKNTVAGQCVPQGSGWGITEMSRALADCAIYMNLMSYEKDHLLCPAELQNYVAENHHRWLYEYPQHFTQEALEPRYHGRLRTAWFIHETFTTSEERRAAAGFDDKALPVDLPLELGSPG